MKFQIPKGCFDITPGAQEPWKDSALWRAVERQVRQATDLFGFSEIRTPIFERYELFNRGVGESSDIVQKEMYTFEDKRQRLMSLRPEGTAPVVRAVIENGLHLRLQKLFYIGPMFRYERQQAGRYRQHHQFGAEVVGSEAPELDAELIDLLWTLLQGLGLKNLTLHLNSLGDGDARTEFRNALVAHLEPRKAELSDDSKIRLKINPLRILDSKDANDQQLLEGAPSILDFLDAEAKRHFEAVQELLKALNIPFQLNPKLVRGLDYYNRTVFEITASELGAQNSLGGGGRYDGLFKLMGGPELPALGFGAGLERIIQTLLGQKIELETKPHPHLVFIPLGEQARRLCFIQAKALREAGKACSVDLSGKKLKGALKAASEADFVAIVGDDELTRKSCQLKDMHAHTSQEVPLAEVEKYV